MPRSAATLPAPVTLAVALAVASAGAAVGSAAPAPPVDAAQAAGVVRLHAPAAPAATATADADAPVIRAQNRGGRGKRAAARSAPVRQASSVRRGAPAPQAAPALPPAPMPRMHAAQSHAVQPVGGVRPIADVAAPGGVRMVNGTCHNNDCGPHGSGRSCGRCPAGTCFGLGGRHGSYANCPHCYGQCPPGGCPVCFGLPGLPMLPACGLLTPGSGLFAPGGYFNRGGVWVPRHVHNYSYDAPEGLLYPPGANNPNAPGRMGPMPAVQYPYYTTKGPDDYFHDRDGEF